VSKSIKDLPGATPDSGSFKKERLRNFHDAEQGEIQK